MRPWHSRCVIALVAAAGLAIAASVSFAQSPQGQAGQSAADSQGQPTSQRERSSQGSPDSEPPRSTRVTHISEVVRSISECLANDQEAVLFTDSVDCMPYRQGQYHLKPSHSDAPFDFNSEKHCPEESSNRPFNGRRLTAETIKTIAKNTDKKIGPHGIRILRAIFCEKVDLVGLELPFSLVLDKSVFTEGIEIRNIKMRGDLSFDDSFVFKHLIMVRLSRTWPFLKRQLMALCPSTKAYCSISLNSMGLQLRESSACADPLSHISCSNSAGSQVCWT